jgi:hypothetical protein
VTSATLPAWVVLQLQLEAVGGRLAGRGVITPAL